MAGDTIITIVGNATDDAELRFTPAGAAVASFTVASTPRAFDKNANEWKDGQTLFLRCTVWRQQAEHVAESVTRGTRVVVNGRLVQRSYETKEGEKRTVYEIQADEVAVSLLRATATVQKAQRNDAGQQGQNRQQGGQDDPWQGGQQQRQQQGGWGQQASYSDEPPF